MKTEIEAHQITEIEFARMWGTSGVVPESSKNMLMIADCERERAEVAELNRIHDLALSLPAKAVHHVPRLKAMIIAMRKRAKAEWAILQYLRRDLSTKRLRMVSHVAGELTPRNKNCDTPAS